MIRWEKEHKIFKKENQVFPLQDVSEPVLYEDIFDYTHIPKITFNGKMMPMNPPEDIWITDTTFRDGQQARQPFTTEQIVRIFDYLHKLGGDSGVIRQSEFFLYADRDKKAVAACQERSYKFPQVTGWIRAVKNDLKLVKDMGLKETGILTSASDYHIFYKLKKTRRQAMDDYLGIVKEALSYGIVPRCHLEDVTRADFYGFVIPFVQELMKLSKESGIPIKIRACDTLGLATIYPGATLPRSVQALIYGLNYYGGVPSEQLEWHGHNDFHKAVANSTFAWLYGCSSINGTIFSLGERTGNTPIDGLIMEYISLRGENEGIELSILTEMAEYAKSIGIYIPENYPFVGKNFNTTSAGIHVDGILKNESVYSAFDTMKILHRPLEVTINDKSGAAGIVHWINTRLKQKGLTNELLDKSHEGVGKIYQEISKQYEEGRVTTFPDEEMYALVDRYINSIYVKIK